jgi:RHH-type proline utilization regulon transcriptional repressor/proline dehydrogenase/delta 1-pyrroline-5-carboxylate dehydrogenase
MEQWSLHEIVMLAFETALEQSELRDWPHVGIVVQAYLKNAEEDIDRLVALARRRGAPITVRLVKGAYWDYEQVRARQYGYPVPVFSDKAATDASYERLTLRLIQERDVLYPAFGSHNLRSLSHAIVQASRHGVPDNGYEIQMLYGMAEPERAALRDLGRRVRLYSPIGELIPGMAYLVRRLLENTSNQGFLRQAYREKVDMRKLLQPPRPRQRDNGHEPAPTAGAPALPAPFENCPFTDFTDPAARRRFADAIEAVRQSLRRRVPVVLDGQPRQDRPVLERHCPSDLALHVASVTLATAAEADRAVETALRAFPAWRDRSVDERAALLEALANRLEADRYELAALMTFEVAKPWVEADADLAEAVDFCRYYARQAREELAPRPLDHPPGETNTWLYEGRGPAVVIAPWNFPLAILCGMTTAALVAGNTVIMKPAEQSSALGHALYRHMIEAGFPADVVQFLPGLGEEVGKRLVEHPHTAVIAFTGSMAVGLSIVENAARHQPGQRLVKRVITEMGGKNAIVVDDDADLDEAVAGVLDSAFGYAGQKCSACSRAIVVGDAYDAFTRRLVEAARSLIVAPAHDPACRLGPVVDEEAYDRLMKVIRDPGPGVAPLYVGPAREGGYYVPPFIANIQDPEHPIMQTELFGPILAVMRVESFEEALEVAMGTPYALTGSVYSRNPRHLETAAQRFRAGNLYLNRGCTGARVCRQPFGGSGLSGGGTKAGGPGYLYHFADPRVITENTQRHGFAPDLQT